MTVNNTDLMQGNEVEGLLKLGCELGCCEEINKRIVVSSVSQDGEEVWEAE